MPLIYPYCRSQQLIIIHCALAAHKPGTSARTYQNRFPDPAHWDSDRHYNRLDVHPDQSAPYIHSGRCLLTNGFHGHRICKPVISSSSKRSACFGLRDYIDFLQVKSLARLSLNDQRPVKMLAALRCQKDLSFLKNRINPFKYCFCGLKRSPAFKCAASQTASAAFSLCFLISLRSAILSPFTVCSQIWWRPFLIY